MTLPSTYLLEIGTEELPVSFLETSLRELEDKTREALEKNRLTYGQVRILQTPRRLTVIVEALARSQAASEEVLKGPPVTVALDAQGNPTQAALGYAKKIGVDFSDLQRETIDGADYLVYHKKSSGQPVEQILPEIMPDVVLSLSGSHFMTWDKSEIKFSRPIRWVVSLLDDKPVPLQIGLLKSGQVSRGHRFFSDSEGITVSSVNAYEEELLTHGQVMVSQQDRRKVIEEALALKAKELNGTIPPNEDLLNTVTMIVESPALVVGSFDKAFLSLPEEVIITVMAAHQKYFPVKGDNGKLLPNFITISNNPQANAEATIRHGNEKVLRARLEDAKFFFIEDGKRSFPDFIENLKGITFQKGLGTLYDKTQRLQILVSVIWDVLDKQGEMQADKYTGLSREDAIRAAELSKFDLATNMVRELTELQGVIGGIYAELRGEKKAVANAIGEQYKSISIRPLGYLLSLADKLDSMMAVFAQKDARYPTGSKDPMGLRRMALGVIQTILENQLNLDLDEALQAAYRNLGSLAVESEADSLNRTIQFLLQRFKGYLLDQDFAYDTIDAVLDSDVSPFHNLNMTIERLKALKALQQDTEAFKTIYEPANRTSRILGKAYQQAVQAEDVDPKLFEHPSENALFKALSQVKPSRELALQEIIGQFTQWAPLVEDFFNHVLVNVENPQVKENRYRLLSLLNQKYRYFADFTRLVV